VVFHQRGSSSPAGSSPASVALLVGVILAAAVGLAGLVRGIAELTTAHQRGVVKFGRFVDGLAVLPIAAAAVMWGLRARGWAGPGAIPEAVDPTIGYDGPAV